MEVTYSSKTLVDFQRTTLHYIPEPQNLRSNFLPCKTSKWDRMWGKKKEKNIQNHLCITLLFHKLLLCRKYHSSTDNGLLRFMCFAPAIVVQDSLQKCGVVLQLEGSSVTQCIGHIISFVSPTLFYHEAHLILQCFFKTEFRYSLTCM
jgi:hypothetical protein